MSSRKHEDEDEGEHKDEDEDGHDDEHGHEEEHDKHKPHDFSFWNATMEPGIYEKCLRVSSFVLSLSFLCPWSFLLTRKGGRASPHW